MFDIFCKTSDFKLFQLKKKEIWHITNFLLTVLEMKNQGNI